MAHGDDGPSKERLRHDLGLVLEAFLLRGQKERLACDEVITASKLEQLQQQRPAPGTVRRPSEVMPSSAAAAAAAAASLHLALDGKPGAASHALPCRITQHAWPRRGPGTSVLAPPKHGHLATDGGATHRRPPSPGSKNLQGRPATPPPSEVNAVPREQIILPKKVYDGYGQAPPAKDSSSQLTVPKPVTGVSGVLRENRSSRSELTSERDVLFEKVAQRLDEIATEINRKYFANQDDGPAQRQLTLAVRDLVREATAKSFDSAVSRLIPHDQPEVQQLALLYQLTAAAVHTVGSGTAHARQLADLCVQYAFDRFAGLIIAKGGLELAVGDSDFEVD